MAADDSPTAPDATAPHWHWQSWQPRQPAEPVAVDWVARQLGVAPAALGLERDAHGRPRLDPRLEADASWSHSGEGLLLALARGARVGVDLERIRPRPRALELAARYFTADETAWLRAQPAGAARDTAFLRLWCAKEAVLKAHGRGLAFGLHKLGFAEQHGGLVLVAADPALGPVDAWRLREIVPHPGYVAALAWQPLPRMGA
jgi:4'-phosphopantetheinyl transferase